MTEEKSYCFYNTKFARFTAGACFALLCCSLRDGLLSGYWSLIVRLGIKASVCDD
jgi:hypothetical protein